MKSLGFKAKLFTASISIVIITISCMAAVNIYLSRAEYLKNGIVALENTSGTLHGVIERQAQLARKKILSDLNVFRSIMGISGLPMLEPLYDVDMDIENQTTGNVQSITIPAFKLGSHYLHESTKLVDTLAKVGSVYSSILQLADEKLIRISTTIPDTTNKTVQGQFIPANNEAYKHIFAGERYEGLMTISGQWYVVAYEAIHNFDEKIIGALEVARPLLSPDFVDFIQKVNVGGKGYSYIVKRDESYLVPPLTRKAARQIAAVMERVPEQTESMLPYSISTNDNSVQASITYFKPWDAHIVTTVTTGELLNGVNERIYQSALISSILPLLLAIIVIWFMSRQLVAPMNRLAMVANAVCKGDFDCSFDYKADDAIGETMNAVQHMVREMKNQLGFSRGVLAGVTIPCAVVDLDNRLTHINDAAISLLGKRKSSSKYIGLTLNEVVYHDAERKTLTQIAMDKHEQTDWEVELTRDIDHVTSTLHVVATPIYDLDNALIGAITIWVDLTEERKQKKSVEAKNEIIQQAATEANDIAQSVVQSTQSLAEKILQANNGAFEQRDRAEEASSAMEQMTATVGEVAENASSTAKMSEDMLTFARSGEDIVKQSIDMMRAVHEQSKELRTQMGELGGHATGIGAIMGVITDIADQTNLLALNAAIEAARAGEAGRGFAVVADEVRNLAEKTMAATHEVSNYIRSIQDSAERNIQSTENATKALEECSDMAEQSGASLKSIVEKVVDATTQIQNIATAAEQQSATSDQVKAATTTMNSIAIQTVESMASATTAIEDLNTLAGDLRGAIDNMQT